MKKSFVLVAVVLGSILSAQSVRYGAKAGANVSMLSGVNDTKSKIGFLVGGTAEIKVSDKFAVQPELLFITGGGETNSEESYSESGINVKSSLTQAYTLNSLRLPVMAKYFVTEKFSLEAGPEIGYIVSDKVNLTANIHASSTQSSQTFDVSGYANYHLSDKTVTVHVNGLNDSSTIETDFKPSKFLFGINFGAGYDFTDNFSLGLRYNLGLNPFVKNAHIAGQGPDAEAQYKNLELKNSNLQISLGYKF